MSLQTNFCTISLNLRKKYRREFTFLIFVDLIALRSDLTSRWFLILRQIREICRFLANLVKKKFPESINSSLGGFLFLRFICPSIVTPEECKLLDCEYQHSLKYLKFRNYSPKLNMFSYAVSSITKRSSAVWLVTGFLFLCEESFVTFFCSETFAKSCKWKLFWRKGIVHGGVQPFY
jgi:hypothetical protein